MCLHAGRPAADEQVPAAQTLIRGIVRESRLLKNSQTGREFYWARLDIEPLTLDIVADPRLLSAFPRPAMSSKPRSGWPAIGRRMEKPELAAIRPLAFDDLPRLGELDPNFSARASSRCARPAPA